MDRRVQGPPTGAQIELGVRIARRPAGRTFSAVSHSFSASGGLCEYNIGTSTDVSSELFEGRGDPGLAEGRQERSSPRAFVRSSHDERIDLFEVGEASTVRSARCATVRFGYGKKVTVTA